MTSTIQLYKQTWQIRHKLRKGDTEALHVLQQQRLGEMIAHARQHSRFYAEKYAGLPEGLNDLAQLPVVSKAELMPRFEDWITDPAIDQKELAAFVADPSRIGDLFMGRYLVCTTSGTTGQPAVLLQDAATLTVMGALNILRAMPAWINMRQLGQIIAAGMRTAAVWATGGHYLGIAMMKRQIQQKPSRGRAMRVFSVLSPLEEIVAGLNAFQPAMLNGYATAIALLAEEQAAGRLNIHPVLVMTSSESLAPQDREHIQAAFGCTIADNYGCSEFVGIAAGCREGWLHVNSDWVLLEPVDASMRPVRPGETSDSVLLTNLVNRVQPILRYNLGDRITLRPDPCPCGNPFPAIRVEGRTDDVLRFQNPQGLFLPVLPLALWATIKQTPGISRFQAVQTGSQNLEIRLESVNGDRLGIWPQVHQRVVQYLAAQGLGNVIVGLAGQEPVRDVKSGKFRHVMVEMRSKGSV